MVILEEIKRKESNTWKFEEDPVSFPASFPLDIMTAFWLSTREQYFPRSDFTFLV